jgi:hypothetical protein
MILQCVCGRVCSSRPGLTLHKKKCKSENSAAKPNLQPVIKSKEASALFSLALSIAVDADLALIDRNKSAGRRARHGLNRLRSMIIPLRKVILDKISG